MPDLYLSRLRLGLATNSSSSHSMVTLPAWRHHADIIPDDLDFSTGWRACSAPAKRLVLAGMLRREAPLLWREAQSDPYSRADIEAAWRGEPHRDIYIYSVTLPEDLERRVAVMCDLPEDQFLTGPKPFTASSFGGDVSLPRRPGAEGPVPAAWLALKTLVLRPEVALFSPEENSWDDEISGLPDEWDTLQQAVNRAPRRPDL